MQELTSTERPGHAEGEATVIVAPRSLSSEKVSQRLTLALEDAEKVQHVHSEHSPYRGYATLNRRDSAVEDAPLQELRFPVCNIAAVIEESLKKWGHDHDLYIAQHSYTTNNRSTATLLSLNIGHVDLDTYKSRWIEFSRQALVSEVLNCLEEWGIAPPSYIVWSGRGLQLKWIWTRPLSPKALPRWKAALLWLCQEVLRDFEADEKAILPTQIMRLVGSNNFKGNMVEVVWVDGGDIHNPTTHDFNDWCSQVLPYSQAQVREFRVLMRQYDAWRDENASNRARRAEDFPHFLNAHASATKKAANAIGVTKQAAASIDMLTAGEIWTRRLDVMRQLLTVRGHAGVPSGKGQRHEWVWIAACALAWVNGKQLVPFKSDLLQWAKSHVPTYSEKQVFDSAASVLKRIQEAQGWDRGLYFMSEQKFKEKLNMTEAEAAQISALKSADDPSQRWDIGSMGFEKMRGLSYEEYRAETARRQSAAAQRTNELARATSEGHREKAHQLRAEGLTQAEIARRLGVSQPTVTRWLKT